MNETQKLRLERYAELLRAYYSELGRLRDMQDLVVSQPDGWDEQVEEILDSRAHHDSVAELNLGRSWIVMLSPDLELPKQMDQLSGAFDQLVEDLLLARENARDEKEVDPELIKGHFDRVEESFSAVLGKVAKEIGSWVVSPTIPDPKGDPGD